MNYDINAAAEEMIEASREALWAGDTKTALAAIKAGTEKIEKLAEEKYGPNWHKGIPQNDPF